MKIPAFLTTTPALGDLICATPTIRRLSEVYASKVVVISHNPKVVENLPYVLKSLHINEVDLDQISAQYDLHKTFHLLGKQDNLGIEFKHAVCDIRQYHAKDLGFLLKDSDLHCDYKPQEDDSCVNEFNLPGEYVVIHPVQSWGSRTWSIDNWQSLALDLESNGINVVCIGKDSGEASDQGSLDKPAFHIGLNRGIDLTNQTSLDQTWHILNKSKGVVTMDSGVMHIAGTTDTHIFQLGSNIDPEYRAPYRNSSQTYKYTYIQGSCSIHCASDLRYSLRDWGGIQNVTLIDTCLEPQKNFECKPSYKKVSEKVLEVLSVDIKEEKVITQDNVFLENHRLIKIVSSSLGDTIGAMAVIESSRINNGDRVSVICNLEPIYFKRSYPDIEIFPHDTEPIPNTLEGNYSIGDKKFSEYNRIYYDFYTPLMRGYANQMGVDKLERPKIDLFVGERPVKSKYVCFSMHSTAQAKHWNYPGGWDMLCKRLRKCGLTPVCIDRHFSFGIDGHWNEVPRSAVKKQGMDLKEMTNYIHHSEFFIGVSSGLSWVAHALGKKVVMISGVTTEDNEFEEDTYRLINKDVCNGCINSPEIKFDPSNWLWCPRHEGTKRQFECTKTITPDDVMGVITKHIINNI